MYLFPKTYMVHSEKNGTITVTRFLFWISVVVEGYEQTGTYLIHMMRDALRRLPPEKKVKTVLLLGLGGGGMIPLLERKFPGAHITAVEWDGAMVQIAKDAHQFKTAPEIITGDMFSVLPSLAERFDFIIVDVFYGGVPDQRLAHAEYAQLIDGALAAEGLVLLNLFKSEAFIPAFVAHMHLEKTWKFQYNTLALFSKHT